MCVFCNVCVWLRFIQCVFFQWEIFDGRFLMVDSFNVFVLSMRNFRWQKLSMVDIQWQKSNGIFQWRFIHCVLVDDDYGESMDMVGYIWMDEWITWNKQINKQINKLVILINAILWGSINIWMDSINTILEVIITRY